MSSSNNERIVKALQLTETQVKVVEYLMEGYSNQEIADAIFRSESAVKHHLQLIFARAEVNSRARFMVLLWSKGWGFLSPSVKAVMAVGKSDGGPLPGGANV